MMETRWWKRERKRVRGSRIEGKKGKWIWEKREEKMKIE